MLSPPHRIAPLRFGFAFPAAVPFGRTSASLFEGDFLSASGHAHAVGPGRWLVALASEKFWSIWHGRREKPRLVQEQPSFAKEIDPPGRSA